MDPKRNIRAWSLVAVSGAVAIGCGASGPSPELVDARASYAHAQAGAAPQLSVVAFRCVPKRGDLDEYNLRVLKAIQRDGRIFISSTKLNGRVWLRLAILCASTHREHIDLTLGILKKQIQRA